ncbi:hypothetical protein G6F64_015395 [Rhizopus arrhizus]|uniref:Uncharacterized protein n=1 Tax=Rhizopus oryzae TaxID=64495 RepID=A0A9P7BIC6_RHIOR|nr:hypothetical protein G6F64_015395 [Rhizopus arrhizus]
MLQFSPTTLRAPMETNGPRWALAATWAVGSMTALGWMPGGRVGAMSNSAAILAKAVYGSLATSAAPGAASASSARSTTSEAWLSASWAR